MPGNINDLGRHRDHTVASNITDMEIVSQAVDDLCCIFFIQVRVFLKQLVMDAGRELEVVNALLAPRLLCFSVNAIGNESCNAKNNDGYDSFQGFTFITWSERFESSA